MEGSAENAQAALRIMRKWQWLQYDPDGRPVRPSLGLNLVVSRLAMAGQKRPHSAVLTLLCKGELLATGDYRWRKYEWGNLFYLEGTNADLDQAQWQKLADAIADEQRQFSDNEWPSPHVNLEKLELEKCDVYNWEFGDNRFSTALCPPDTISFDPSYFEESFSAWDIEVMLHDIDGLDSVTEEPSNLKSGRPAAYDWLEATNAIWAKLYGNELIPTVQADIEKALILHLRKGDAEPGQSTVRPFARAIWEKFQEH
ncbi:MAG TPA: hypothetical protein VHG29_03975 [Novosphingobium sp.]|nr:hypothetical protein [Novosphingobium sp.]